MAIKVGAASAKATADAYYNSAGADATQSARDEIQNQIRSASKNGKYTVSFKKEEYPKIFEAYLTLKSELEEVGYNVSMQGSVMIVSWG